MSLAYGCCDFCAKLRPLDAADQVLATHYLRGNRTASTPRGRRRRCPGSRKPPRARGPPLEPNPEHKALPRPDRGQGSTITITQSGDYTSE